MDSKSFLTRRGVYLDACDVTNELIATDNAGSDIVTQKTIPVDAPIDAIAVDTPLDALAVGIGKLPT
jgi:hypothetical protein